MKKVFLLITMATFVFACGNNATKQQESCCEKTKTECGQGIDGKKEVRMCHLEEGKICPLKKGEECCKVDGVCIPPKGREKQCDTGKTCAEKAKAGCC